MTSFQAAADSRIRLNEERRLSVAIGASLLIHALAIAAFRGLTPMIYASPQAGAGNLSVLQAVLAGPQSLPVPTPPSELEAVVTPELLRPPAARPLEPPQERRPQPTGPLPGGNPARIGPNTPEVSIAVGTLDDPTPFGPEFVTRLAQRFPERAAKPPMLLGSPIVAYPQAALAAGAERRVAALLTLRANGSIEDAQLVREDPLFGPAVLDAIRTVQFAPAEIDGNPVPYWAIVEVVFSLGRPQQAPAAAAPGPARRGLIFPRQPSVGK